MGPRSDLMEEIEIGSSNDWRAWLKNNHETSKGVWLIFRMKSKMDGDEPALTVPEAIDEALCFGWIDSLAGRVDDQRYKLKFTPRGPKSKWSRRNLQRAVELIEQGRMTEAGAKALPKDINERLERPDPHVTRTVISYTELEEALKKNPAVWEKYRSMTPGRRKEFAQYVSAAKRPETKARRIEKVIEDIERTSARTK